MRGLGGGAETSEGWWVAYMADGRMTCIERTRDMPRETLPPGWTLGPRVDDLMRDAARYRWLLAHPGRLINDLYDPDEASTKADVDDLIDAEIARERSGG